MISSLAPGVASAGRGGYDAAATIYANAAEELALAAVESPGSFTLQ